MMFVVPWLSYRFFRADFEQARHGHVDQMPIPAIVDRLLLKWGLWISAVVFVGFFTRGFAGMPTAVPATVVMIPIIHRLIGGFAGDPTVLWWALALGACLGGNGTLVGASANVTTIGMAERSGMRISFGEFTRFGARIAAITIGISSVYLATHVYLGSRKALAVWATLVAVILAWKGGAATHA